MELLRFTVRNQNLSGGRNKLVSDSIDYVEAFFDFRTSDWSGLSKWAHFSKGEEVYDINLVDDKITRDMHLNLGAGIWEVKLHGTDPEGTMRITTDRAHVVVESYGSMEEGSPLPEIPLSQAEQIDAKSQKALDNSEAALSTANEAYEKAEAVERAAANGEFKGEKGDPGITPEFSIGNVETLLPEEEAMVTLGGTAEKPVLNFGIPQGEPGKDAGALVVTITGSEEEGYSADKPFRQIRNAYNSGKTVYCKGSSSDIAVPLNGTYMPLSFISGSYIVFTGTMWDYTQTERNYITQIIYEFEIKADDTVSLYYGEQNALPSPAAMSINGESYDGKTEKDFTEAINAMIGESLTDIKSDIADLKYVPIAVSSFSHNAGTRENGDKVSSVVLSWVLNKAPESLVIDGVQTKEVQSGSVTVAEEITAKRTFELSATDDREATATKSTTIYFYDGIYYGCAEEPEAVDSEFILSLTKKLSSGKNFTVSVTGGENKFFWYAYPASMGESIFNIGGFDYEFESETISFENAFGVIKDYIIYVSDNPMLSNNSITVKEG